MKGSIAVLTVVLIIALTGQITEACIGRGNQGCNSWFGPYCCGGLVCSGGVFQGRCVRAKRNAYIDETYEDNGAEESNEDFDEDYE